MFFDIGWPELMLIGVVALVVIGPKDLPAALRVAGYWMRKARTMSREFHSSIEQMIREAELDEVQKELKKATDINLDHEINKIIDPVSDPAIKSTPPDVPDYFDTASAPADPLPAVPPPAAETAAEDEPELPLPFPPAPARQDVSQDVSRAAEPEPARVEPIKP